MTEHANYKYENQDVELADFFRAMALPARVSIIKVLLSKDDWIVGSQFNVLPLTDKVIEKHLEALKAVDLVFKMKKNGITFYKLNLEIFKYMSSHFDALLKN